MLPETQITAVSTYGRAGASTRVRLYDWFESLGITSERFEYLSTSDNQPSTILKSPYRALRAEANLRRLLSQLNERTLVLSRQPICDPTPPLFRAGW